MRENGVKKTAEEEFYAQHRAGSDIAVTPPVAEFKSWSDANFCPTGRYALIPRVLSRNQRIDRLIEIGCGGGESLVWMKDFATEAVGADITIPTHLKNGTLEGIRFIEHNANDSFPFQDNWFDVVVTMMVMEHVFDPFHFTSEVARILKPGGILFLNVPLVTGLKNRLRLLTGHLPVTSQKDWFQTREWDGGHLHYFSWKTLITLLQMFRFEVENYSCPGNFSSLKRWLPKLLCNEISVQCHKI